MKDEKGVRDFLRNAAAAALAFPTIFQWRPKAAYAVDGSSTEHSKAGKAKLLKKICVEEHWAPTTGEPPRLPKSVNTAAMPQVVQRLKDFELRLPLMDESGIAMQVLAPAPIQVIPDTNAAVAAASKCNDAAAETVQKYAPRFSGFAAIPTQDPKAAADELQRAVTQLGLKGAMVYGHTNAEYMDEQKFWPVWEGAEALGVPIYLHPFDPLADAVKSYEGHPELLGPTRCWVADTATHALRVIGAGGFDAFPKAAIILGHLGEALPYLLGRFDEGYAMTFKNKTLKKPISAYVKENVLITTSGKYQAEALACAIKAVGIDHVLFAVDYPFVAPKESVQLVQSTPMSRSDREKIYYRNAERWLKL